MECHYLISERAYEELLTFKAKYLELKAKQKKNDQGQQGTGCQNKNDQGQLGTGERDDCQCPKPGPTTYTEPQYTKLLQVDSSSGLANLDKKPKPEEREVKTVDIPNGSKNEIFKANLLNGVPSRHNKRAEKIVQIIIDNAPEENGYFKINEVKYSQTHLKTLLKSVLNNNKTWLQGRQNFCDYLKLHGLIMRSKNEKKASVAKKKIQTILNSPPKNWYCMADLLNNVNVTTSQPSTSDDI